MRRDGNVFLSFEQILSLPWSNYNVCFSPISQITFHAKNSVCYSPPFLSLYLLLPSFRILRLICNFFPLSLYIFRKFSFPGWALWEFETSAIIILSKEFCSQLGKIERKGKIFIVREREVLSENELLIGKNKDEIWKRTKTIVSDASPT